MSMTSQQLFLNDNSPDVSDMLRAREWLNNGLYSIEMELGCHKGHLLCKIARRNSHIKYIGVDVSTERCTAARYRADSLGIHNVIFIAYEGRAFLREFVRSNSIDVMHLYFPTPFDSQHNFYRSLRTKDFVREVHRVLVVGGLFRILTDHKTCFLELRQYAQDMNFWVTEWSSLKADIPSGFFAGTPHEVIYRELDSIIYSCQLVK